MKKRHSVFGIILGLFLAAALPVCGSVTVFAEEAPSGEPDQSVIILEDDPEDPDETEEPDADSEDGFDNEDDTDGEDFDDEDSPGNWDGFDSAEDGEPVPDDFDPEGQDELAITAKAIDEAETAAENEEQPAPGFVKTGDDRKPGVWLTVLIIAGSVAVTALTALIVLLARHKKNKNGGGPSGGVNGNSGGSPETANLDQKKQEPPKGDASGGGRHFRD